LAWKHKITGAWQDSRSIGLSRTAGQLGLGVQQVNWAWQDSRSIGLGNS
jgi:hypothetical protein